MSPIRFVASRLLVAAFLLIAPLGASPAAAQSSAREHAALVSAALRSSPALAEGKYAVVVDLDANRLHYMQGRNILWSAPVGTGAALRLETGNKKWDFSTPTGVYHVQYKEENPVWIAPDWYFIENGLPVPPQNDKQRFFPNGLGAAAVYIGRGLAIHGTDKPDLLGQRVSHGCIRLENKYAQRLFHNVQTGTEVVIIGEEKEEPRVVGAGVKPPGAGPADPATQRVRDRAKAERERVLKELAGLSTEKLVARLEEELESRTVAEEGARWPELAGELLRRVRKDDVEAARGLLDLIGTVRDQRVRAEYGTFLVDAYSRGAPLVTRVLAGMDEAARERVAGAIVESAIALYHGGADEPVTPWPTRRIPRMVLEEDAQQGWDVLAGAERSYRETHRIGIARGGG